jgi:CubicO group peptidase (beta-lactamase class C family)
MAPLTPLFLALAAALTSATIVPAASQPVNGEGEWSGSVSFDQRVQQFISQNNIPGVTVAVSKGGRLVLSKGYGFANIASQTPMLPSHNNYIGSTSKIITAIGALALTEEGKLDLQGRVYGTGKALWGSDIMAPPSGILVSGTSVLKDPGDYFAAMVEGVHNLDPNFPPSVADNPSLLAATLYRASVDRTLEWASAMRVKHLLSHTSGLLRSGTGATEEAESQFDQVSYKEVHLVVLKALVNDADGNPTPPFFAAPETESKYSNHGFGLLGYIISEKSGESYEDYIRERVLTPLGLHAVVRGGTSVALAATPYEKEDHPFLQDAWTPKAKPYTVSNLGLATGGWMSTAKDLVRLMCALDKKTTAPILNPGTVGTMEAIAYPAIDSSQPLGWDKNDSGKLYKNGLTSAGGMSQIIKFLPGTIGADEINIAIVGNIEHKPGDIDTELQTLAKIVAAASIPDTYDLFDPEHPCYVGAVAGTVTQRDNSPSAPACPRPAEVGASIRTNNAGDVPYVLTCTGDNRKWEGTMTAHQTDENTFLGVVVHPMEIAKQEEILCVLRRGEQVGIADVLATDKRTYPCQMTSVAIPESKPPPPEKPKRLIPPTTQQPQLVCQGGKVATRGKPPKPFCDCPKGYTAQKVKPSSALQALARRLGNKAADEPDRYRCVRAEVVVTCTGGKVQGVQCICPSGWTRQTIANTATAKVYNCKPPAPVR